MSREESPELVSWKEIARRLGRSVRTVQQWEKERGLPVRRVPGAHGGVFIRRDDLERWLAETEGERTKETASSRAPDRRTVLFAAGAAIALFATVAWWTTPELRSAVAWRVEGDTVVAMDSLGAEIWRTELVGGLTRDESAVVRVSGQFVDLDEDGSMELLLVQVPRLPEQGDTLICLSSDGEELWRYRPGIAVSTAQHEYNDVFLISTVKTGRLADGSRVLVVASHHYLYYQSRIVALSVEGTAVGDYLHAGHIGSGDRQMQVVDADGDGASEIYAAGVNNARAQATLVVLDPETMRGAGAEPDPDYQFRDLPAGRETARLFFQRSSVNRAEDRFNVAYDVLVGANGGATTITVAVREATFAPGDPTVHYELGHDLQLRAISLSDTFIGAHQKLSREGQVNLDLSQEEEELRAIEVVR